MNGLKESLNKKEFSRVYIFFGTEEFLKKFYLDKLKNLRITPDEELMNLEIFEEKSILAKDIEQSALTPPFLGDCRFIIVKNSGFFKISGKDREEGSEQSNEIIDVIDKIPEDVCVVFIENEVDKRSKLYKKIQKIGRAIEFKAPSEVELSRWIEKEFAKRKIKTNKNTILYFIRYIGGDMELASKEIEKLSAYASDKGRIEIEDLDKICVKAFQTKIFDLVESMGKKNLERALEIYMNMIIAKEPPMRIFAMVTRQIRMIYQCKNLAQEGYETNEIAVKLNLRDFMVGEALREANNFSFKEIKEAMFYCLETDKRIKMGLMKDDLAVEMLIIKYGSKKE